MARGNASLTLQAYNEALSTWLDAVPLVNRLKLVVQQRNKEKIATAQPIAALNDTYQLENDSLQKILAAGVDEKSLTQAVADARSRVALTQKLVEVQGGEVADARDAAVDASKSAANSNLTDAEAASASQALTDALSTKKMAEGILADMVRQVTRAKSLLRRRIDALDNPSLVEQAANDQQNVTDTAKAALDAAVATDNAAAAALQQALNDLSVANASIPVKQLNVSTTKIAFTRANGTYTIAFNNNVTAYNRMVTALGVWQAANDAAAAAGFSALLVYPA
eukprot:TRINITY_DN16330_c0_g2_i1.p1 TRINITY_DN16330_c0_g2~~TRINITY_DN16330_c0_g2_i1.p1  ORF type:complete len:289 (+),score=34.69 TRINITY_DN16330_c0_g2_i1:25-867(+)